VAAARYVRKWASARVAINSCAAGGVTKSASPTRYHDGIAFQRSAAGAFSLNALAVSGRCVLMLHFLRLKRCASDGAAFLLHMGRGIPMSCFSSHGAKPRVGRLT
jgi:hypothetical protein